MDSKQGRVFTITSLGDKIIGTSSQVSIKFWDTEVKLQLEFLIFLKIIFF